MLLTPDAAIAFQQYFEFDTRQVREVFPEARHADAWPELIRELNNVIALIGRGSHLRPAQRSGRPERVQQIMTPLPQRAFGDLEQRSHVAPEPAKIDERLAGFRRMLSRVALSETRGLLLERAAALGRR